MSKKQTQCARILELLSSGREISALELSAVSLQYCARLAELRKAGYSITNRLAAAPGGVRHGYYRLAQRPAFRLTPSQPFKTTEADSLFTEPTHLDLG